YTLPGDASRIPLGQVSANSLNDSKILSQPFGESTAPRASAALSPMRSKQRCSSSMRVVSAPSAMNLTSTSVTSPGSYCHCGLICQARTNAWGGVHAITYPVWQVEPSSPTEYQRPPTRGSMMHSFSGDLRMEWLAGHQRDMSAVNTAKARD